MNKISLLLGLFILGLVSAASAREPYHVKVGVDAESARVSAPNLVDLKRELSSENIEKLIPIYTPNSAASLDINLRGILASASFAQNSTTLVVQIPQAGITQTFTGGSREESIALFKESLTDAGPHHRLLKAYAAFSPIDPIAGNPNSLMARMGQADYAAGHLSPFSGCDCSWSAQPIVHQVQAGIEAGRTFGGGFDTTCASLPLRYSYSPDLEQAFILDAPVTYLRNGGASSLVGSLGIGYRFPVTHAWTLTPIVRWGAGGSLDLCTAGAFLSAGITSVFNYKISDYVIGLTNYASYITSTNFWLTGVNFNYHLHNAILKNGLSFTTCDALCWCERPINFSVGFIDSYFARKRLYMRHYDEISLSMIVEDLNPCLDYDCLSLSFSFQFGQHRYKGYLLSLLYQL